jgi:hypothetical protein
MNSAGSDLYINYSNLKVPKRKRSCNNHLHEEITQSDFTKMLQNPPCKLYLHVDDLLSPSNKPKSKKSNTIKMPRNQNPFILYRKNEAARRKELGIKNDSNIIMISKEISEMWNNESPKIKTFFQILATEGDRRHRIKFPGYKYTPIRKNKNSKRCFRIKLPSIPDNSEKNSDKKESISELSENNTFVDLSLSNQWNNVPVIPFFDPTFFSFDRDPILFPEQQQQQQQPINTTAVNEININMNNQYDYNQYDYDYSLLPYYNL